MKLFNHAVARVAIFISIFFTSLYGSCLAQFAVKTFGSFEKVKAAPDKPKDFKTSFPLKAQVYVELTYPEEPAFYTIDCYQVDDNGKEKLVGTTDIKCFEKKSGKTIKSPQSLGMMYNAGKYKITAMRQSDKKIVAENSFTVTGEAATPARTIAEVIFAMIPMIISIP